MRILKRNQKEKQNNELNSFRKRIYLKLAMAISLGVLIVALIFAVSIAWYTNVVQTSGLSFEASVWGFKGNVEIQDESIIGARPGKNGTVGMTFENSGDEIVYAGVEVSKELMSRDLQKRIYFYIDSSKGINEETVEKVYLGGSDNYSYLLMPKDTLSLTDEVHDNAPVKWEWVYDVLGYYVKGTVTEGDDGKFNLSSDAEYIMPVKYDYDKATFDDDGFLETVDGEKTSAEFIAEISSKDGYKGTVDTNAARGNYYAVDVEENTGIWLCLLTKPEIEYETVIDTALGSKNPDEELSKFTARLTVTAVNGDLVQNNIGTAEDLKEALSAGDEYIKLTNSVTLDSYIELPRGKSSVLDLNGNVLTASYVAMVTWEGSSLTVVNGDIECIGEKVPAFQIVGSKLELVNVGVKSKWQGLLIADYVGSGATSEVRLSGCKIDAEYCALTLCGNGTLSEQKTHVYIKDSEITSSNLAISGSGTVTENGQWGTDVYILNSKVNGGAAAIYQPQQKSSLTVSGSDITGGVGIAVKGGDILIKGGSIVKGTDEKMPADFTSGGFTQTGDGLYIETNYDWDRSVQIDGGSRIISEKSEAIEVYKADDARTSLSVREGFYSSDVSSLIDVTQYSCALGEDGFYEVVKK